MLAVEAVGMDNSCISNNSLKERIEGMVPLIHQLIPKAAQGILRVANKEAKARNEERGAIDQTAVVRRQRKKQQLLWKPPSMLRSSLHCQVLMLRR